MAQFGRISRFGLCRKSGFPLHTRVTIMQQCCFQKSRMISQDIYGQPQKTQWDSYDKQQGSSAQKIAMVGAVFLGSLSAAWYLKRNVKVFAKEATAKPGERRKDLPDYRKVDIQAHKSKATGIWVTYKSGVYDISEFVEGHPGGEKILLAAGGALEPFWEMYAVHKNSDVFEILEELRIGNIHPEDLKNLVVKKSNDPFANDPERHPALKVNSAKPFNAETPFELLTDNFLTPNGLFFVRNHLPVPNVESKGFKLGVMGEGMKKEVSFSIGDLRKKFKVEKIAAAVQCGGNRRSQMAKVKPVKGLSWGTCAISNAEWTGVKLSEVLKAAGIEEKDGYHVIFQGLDTDIEKLPYEASIPIETAMDPKRDVLLAFEMNGEELPLDHGFPLRVVVPGTVGARQVKWLSKIIVSKDESSSHWQQNDYKTFHPSTDWDTVDFSKAVPIQDYPIQSAITEPKEGQVLSAGEDVTVKGYAWSGGGRGIIRVDVSLDGGKTWGEAKLNKTNQRLHRQWAWTLFEAEVPIPKDHKGELQVVCKAVDTSHNQQPESAEAIWNLRGLVHNAWHKVDVKLEQ